MRKGSDCDYNKRNISMFNFPIVNLPFICSNIPAAPAYISQSDIPELAVPIMIFFIEDCF
jgi:hypothetical protein